MQPRGAPPAITDWIGPLSSTQERQLTLSIEHLPDVLDIWLAHTKERQQQFVEIVRSARGDRAAASQALVTWITAETLPPQLAAHRIAIYDLIIEIDRLCTKAQRDHVVANCRPGSTIYNWQKIRAPYEDI